MKMAKVRHFPPIPAIIVKIVFSEFVASSSLAIEISGNDSIGIYSNNNKRYRFLRDRQVSSICNKNGEKVAYITFSDSKRQAEGEIPKCMINSNNGFSEDEIHALEEYMRQNLDMLKGLAKDINPIRSIF